MLKPRDGAIGFQDRGGSKMHHTRSLLLDVNVLAVLIHATCPNVDRVQESLGSFRVSGDLFQWSPLCCPLMVILRGEDRWHETCSRFCWLGRSSNKSKFYASLHQEHPHLLCHGTTLLVVSQRMYFTSIERSQCSGTPLKSKNIIETQLGDAGIIL